MHKKSKQTNKKNLDKKRLPLFLAPFLQNTGGRAIDCEQLVFFSAQRSLNGGFFYFFIFFFLEETILVGKNSRQPLISPNSKFLTYLFS